MTASAPQSPNSVQPTPPSPPALRRGPQPLDAQDLRQVSGGKAPAVKPQGWSWG